MKNVLYFLMVMTLLGCTSAQKKNDSTSKGLNANCYIIDSVFTGHTARERTGFEFIEEKIDLVQRTYVKVDGERSKILYQPEQECSQNGRDSIICFNGQGDPLEVIEQWSVFPNKHKVIFTTIIQGAESWDGGRLLVGNIIGTCNNNPPFVDK